MVFKNLCILVLLTKVASALKWLTATYRHLPMKAVPYSLVKFLKLTVLELSVAGRQDISLKISLRYCCMEISISYCIVEILMVRILIQSQVLPLFENSKQDNF